ncbi:MAG: hypothetical protein PHV74_03600 [Dehalococcoidia bacterium]|nr:hypothetical protein [Dehalococcoidia bacterium]
MINLVAFEIGEQYENRKGKYEVLEIEGDDMRIRWDDGDEISTSVTMQSHILNQIREHLERLALNKTPPPVKKAAAPNGWHRVVR